MAKKKHVFHCNKCHAPTVIYKKGKGHRILLCPNCGILATNPLPLLGMAAASLAPALIDKVTGGSKKAAPQTTTVKNYNYEVEKYSNHDKIHDALR